MLLTGGAFPYTTLWKKYVIVKDGPITGDPPGNHDIGAPSPLLRDDGDAPPHGHAQVLVTGHVLAHQGYWLVELTVL